MSIKRLTAIILAFVLVLSLAGCGKSSGDNSSLEIITAKPTDMEEEPVVNPNEIVLDKETILDYANESVNMWEYTQHFFDDAIVYKDDLGQFALMPVDDSLPKSNYNWDNLERIFAAHTEYEYREGGETVSLKGIDVSQYQEEINWEKVAADGVKFAFIRIGYRGYGSQGKLQYDERYEENIKGALKNGIAVGVYFLTQAISVAEAQEEARFVLDAIAPYNVSWPVVLDVEGTSGKHPRTENLDADERTEYVAAFCDVIADNGYTPMIYSNISWFLKQMMLERLTKYDKWFAQYWSRPFFPYEFSVWQYTSSGRVDGITGSVDLNISMKDFGKKEAENE